MQQGIGHKTMCFGGGTTPSGSRLRSFLAGLAFVQAAGTPDVARAEPLSIQEILRMASERPIALAALFLAVVVFSWALIVVRKLSRDARIARKRVVELETALDEAEAALVAEPNILIIWRGRDPEPERIAGDMRGTVRLPAQPKPLLTFARWCEPESATALSEAVANLRETGAPFNIGIKTIEGEFLEADGRTAGALATLRLRPLAGERRHNFELAYDTRKLTRQVERLSAILDRAPFPIWLRGTKGELTWVNRAYLKAVENDNIEEVLARRVELVSPVPAEAGAAEREPVRRAHAVMAGAKRALDLHELALGESSAVFAIDTTALEDTRKELKRLSRAHASTLDKIATAIAIFGPDQRLRFYNSAYAELWSLDAPWLDTHPQDSEILDQLRSRRLIPEQANYREWKARELQSYTTIEPRESWWHLPDGRTLRVVAEQHPFGGVTYLYDNVTERLSLESRYNELIDVQRETLDNLHEGVALVGSDGSIRLHNPSYARFWKLEPEFLNKHPHIEQVIAHCRALMPDDVVWEEMKYALTSLGEGRSPHQARLARPDGIVLDFASVPLPDGNTLLTYVDVTASADVERALRERNEALEAADRLKTNFLQNISYELRTPLNSIIGFSEGLTMGIAGPLLPKQQEYLADIQTSSNDLLAIIDAILDLTSIDAGAMELRLEEIDVARLLEETALAAQAQIDKRDLTLNVEIATDADHLVGDDKRVRQVLANLLSNAIGFSDKGASVRMGARRDGDHIALWVSDTGRGIDPEFQKRAFDRFQSRPVSGGHRGPGLGLSIVKSFVELHEGKVSLISRVNRGTTVICHFPIAGPRAVRARPALASAPVAQASGM
ncbi:MAG: ATP-binding protein [Parvibaculaceae bacterium]